MSLSKRLMGTLSTTISIVFFAACSPSINLIDRQTILELEASGEWQELDQKFQDKELSSGPLPTSKTRERESANKTLRMTHADNPSTKSETIKNTDNTQPVQQVR
jgi:hypothetical protein